MNKLEEDNTSKDLVVYSNYELGYIVKKYDGEVGITAWIDKANDKAEFLELDWDYEEEEKDGEGGVAYFVDDSNGEIEPSNSEDDESDKSINDAEENGDEEEVLVPITDEKQHGNVVGKAIPQRKWS